MSDKDFVIHGVHEYHGWNEPVRKGMCRVPGHKGQKRGVSIFGTVNGKKSCHECMNEVHINSVTWNRKRG